MTTLELIAILFVGAFLLGLLCMAMEGWYNDEKEIESWW